MAGRRVYLDHNATAPLRPEARDAMVAALEVAGNPSSVHAEGRAARVLLEDSRADVAALVGARPRDVVFTSGATEAAQLAICGAPGARGTVVSAIEHPAVLAAAERRGAPVVSVPPAANGVVSAKAMAAATGDAGADVVALMVANNETGIVQPVAEMARAVRALASDAIIVCDAVQGAGRCQFDLAGLGVDALILSAHKIGGPRGVGALVLAPGVRDRLTAQMTGGGQELRLRGGTENLVGIAGFAGAARAAFVGPSQGEAQQIAALRNALETGLRALDTSLVPVGADVERLCNTTAVAVPGVSAETLVIALDLAGLAVSAGAACSSGRVGRSHVLAAMPGREDLADGAVRISLGWNSSKEDVAAALTAWERVLGQVRRRAAA